MTQMQWGTVGERYFEAGVDRGVLYVDNLPGVPWNGLVSVNQSSSGGESTPYYLEGEMYLNRPGAEEFTATIEAYTYPSEFSVCDGTVAVRNGLFITRQRRKPFGLAYRTMVGNDTDGLEHAYKLHLIYDALAQPSDREYATTSDSMEPFNFSWEITTRAPLVRGHRRTAHFVIDSRETPNELLASVEDILYGTTVSAPRLPTVNELFFLFTNHNTTFFSGGDPDDVAFQVFDAGVVPTAYTSTLDGGAP